MKIPVMSPQMVLPDRSNRITIDDIPAGDATELELTDELYCRECGSYTSRNGVFGVTVECKKCGITPMAGVYTWRGRKVYYYAVNQPHTVKHYRTIPGTRIRKSYVIQDNPISLPAVDYDIISNLTGGLKGQDKISIIHNIKILSITIRAPKEDFEVYDVTREYKVDVECYEFDKYKSMDLPSKSAVAFGMSFDISDVNRRNKVWLKRYSPNSIVAGYEEVLTGVLDYDTGMITISSLRGLVSSITLEGTLDIPLGTVFPLEPDIIKKKENLLEKIEPPKQLPAVALDESNFWPTVIQLIKPIVLFFVNLFGKKIPEDPKPVLELDQSTLPQKEYELYSRDDFEWEYFPVNDEIILELCKGLKPEARDNKRIHDALEAMKNRSISVDDIWRYQGTTNTAIGHQVLNNVNLQSSNIAIGHRLLSGTVIGNRSLFVGGPGGSDNDIVYAGGDNTEFMKLVNMTQARLRQKEIDAEIKRAEIDAKLFEKRINIEMMRSDTAAQAVERDIIIELARREDVWKENDQC